MGLPRELRLRSRKDFDAVFQHGRAWNDTLLVLRALPNDLSHSRYGFVTSKRVGGAVVRNRIRRRLREIVRELPLADGYDVVLSAKRAAADADFISLSSAVERLVGRAGFIPSSGDGTGASG